MSFESILFDNKTDAIKRTYKGDEDFFRDLNLDIVISEIIQKDKYNLKEYFLSPLRDTEVIRFRQEVMKDLESSEELFNEIKNFTQIIFDAVSDVERANKILLETEGKSKNYLEKGRFLDSLIIYLTNIEDFVSRFSKYNLNSKGLKDFRNFITEYANSEGFKKLKEDALSIRSKLKEVKYNMLIKDSCIKVRPYEDEEDYTVEIEKIFEKFKKEEKKDYRKQFPEDPFAEHVEVWVLNLVSKFFEETFKKLDEFYEQNKNFVEEKLARFSKELQFYIAYLEFINKVKPKGLKFTYPEVTSSTKEIYARSSFDLALASKLRFEDTPVVTNDFYLKEPERIIVVSGPNQGGKTTFARMIGEIHYFANLGLPVPGIEARLYLFDNIFTHFEREEDIKSLKGKLENDLLRMKNIINNATSDSIIIINEFLASTALKDAVLIGKKIMDKLLELNCITVWVTFLDELSRYSEKTVSMVSTVDPEDPSKRTFRILRKEADGLSYAIYIAKKYGLTYEELKERMRK